MNGDTVIAYVVEIQTSVSTVFSTETLHCDGSLPSIVSSMTCNIPFSSLRAAPFNLILGDLIRVQVSAINNFGQSPFSAYNTAGATLETEPTQMNPVT